MAKYTEMVAAWPTEELKHERENMRMATAMRCGGPRDPEEAMSIEDDARFMAAMDAEIARRAA